MNAQNLCETCYFFVLYKDEDAGDCNNPKIMSDFDQAEAGKDPACAPIDGIYASCDEDRGVLEVGRKFGCIHHQTF